MNCKKGKCRFKSGKLDGQLYKGSIYNISSFIWVKQGDDNALMEVIDKYGPVAVAIDASHPSFTSYTMGYHADLKETCDKKIIGFKK